MRGILGPIVLITLPLKIPNTAKQEYKAALPFATRDVSEARDPPAPIPWIAFNIPISSALLVRAFLVLSCDSNGEPRTYEHTRTTE